MSDRTNRGSGSEQVTNNLVLNQRINGLDGVQGVWESGFTHEHKKVSLEPGGGGMGLRYEC